MLHGPACPVRITPLKTLDQAMAIAGRPGTILTSFGDMLRVRGTDTDVLSLRARGADVRVVHTPMEAVRIAADCPERQVVFLAVGFETTAAANAMGVRHAARLRLANFSMASAETSGNTRGQACARPVTPAAHTVVVRTSAALRRGAPGWPWFPSSLPGPGP